MTLSNVATHSVNLLVLSWKCGPCQNLIHTKNRPVLTWHLLCYQTPFQKLSLTPLLLLSFVFLNISLFKLNTWVNAQNIASTGIEFRAQHLIMSCLSLLIAFLSIIGIEDWINSNTIIAPKIFIVSRIDFSLYRKSLLRTTSSKSSPPNSLGSRYLVSNRASWSML